MVAFRVAAVGLLIAVVIAAGALLVNGSGESGQAPPPASPDQPQAAVRAATRFLLGLDARRLADDRSRRRFISHWASREAAASLQRLYAAEAEQLDPPANSYSRAALMGYRVDRLTDTSAEVTIWAVSLASVGDHPAAVGWRTLTVTLVRESQDWKVTQVREVPGPNPGSDPAQLRREAKRFHAYRIAP